MLGYCLGCRRIIDTWGTSEQALTCFKRIKELEEQVIRLQSEIDTLNLDIQLMPGGTEYLEAKSHFESLAKCSDGLQHLPV